VVSLPELLVPVDVLEPLPSEPGVGVVVCDSEPVAVVDPLGSVEDVGVDEPVLVVAFGSVGTVSNPPAAAAAAEAAPFSMASRLASFAADRIECRVVRT